MGVWAPERRGLTVGLVFTITLVAFESLAIATILPDVKDDLGGLGIYGWVFSAFFLGSLLGVVVAGTAADHRGPAGPYLAGLGLFTLGLLVGGFAPSMLVLVIGRLIQGIGAGAVPAVAYASIGRAYPDELRPRVFAIMSTAWVVPGLLGPGLASAVSHAVGWRWVFLGLVPLAVIAGAISYRALRPLDVIGGKRGESRLSRAIRVAVGVGLVLGGLSADSLIVAVPIAVAGVVLAFPALLELLPPGTMRARPGMPAAVLVRGSLTFAFFAADAYVPLAITDARGSTTLFAGIALTASCLSWTAGSWIQARVLERVGPRRLVVVGHAVLVAGIACALPVLSDSVPLALIVPAWTVAGLGIGLSYAPISVVVLREAPTGQEGTATAGMQLTDLLGVALGTGLGGAAVGLGDALGWDPAIGIAIAWTLAGAVAACGIALGTRLPGPSSVEAEEDGRVLTEHSPLPLG